MNKQLLKDCLGWGLALWLIGYILGIVLFYVVPKDLIGYFIMPIGTIIMLWVLFKKIKSTSFTYYLILSFAWVLIAVVFDYLFMVKALNSGQSYYKADIYLYYILTFIIPLVVGCKKKLTLPLK
ncbi:MAG: hypothetical protein PHR47_00200 [Candidatus Pacebacteria bacterium]|nr:hypothetical protein [Candidatus Paceibacterota bacterium]